MLKLYSFLVFKDKDKAVDGISDGVAKTKVDEAAPVPERRKKEQKKNMSDAEINEGLSMAIYVHLHVPSCAYVLGIIKPLFFHLFQMEK